jgi:hypothetical protein
VEGRGWKAVGGRLWFNERWVDNRGSMRAGWMVVVQ